LPTKRILFAKSEIYIDWGDESMSLFPINLSLDGRQCLVLGGGQVAERKVFALVAAKGKVTVYSPSVTDKLRELIDGGGIDHISASYRSGTMKPFFIVICATDDPRINLQAAEEARSLGSLVNVVNGQEFSDFTVPAHISRGDLLITVSTNGRSPVLARRLKEEIAGLYGPEYGLYLEIVARLRTGLKNRDGTSADRQAFWRENLDDELLALLRAGKIQEAEEKIQNAAGCTRTQS
jgi:precorrin-2 dehydrogenase / sirohydrochlorin ferrochelatase